MSFGLPQAFLLGTIFEALLYGAYTVVFVEHMRVLYRRRSSNWSHLYCQWTSCALFTLMTMSITVGITRCMQAFTTNLNTPDFPTLYYEVFNTTASRIRVAVYMAATMVSDLFLVYRCFVVWGNNHLVALIPFLIFLADLALAIWAANSVNEVYEGNISRSPVIVRSEYLFIVTLILNLTCTGLIAYKIWRIQRRVSTHIIQPHGLNRISTILIESAGIYSAFLIALITTNAIGSPAFFFIYDIMPPVIGISFSAIIVRAEMTRAPRIPSTIKSRTGAGGGGSGGRTAPFGGVHIQLETFTHASPPPPFVRHSDIVHREEGAYVDGEGEDASARTRVTDRSSKASRSSDGSALEYI